MVVWNYDETQYKAYEGDGGNYDLIPVGDYRCRIEDVTEKTFSTGSQGFEITLKINGYDSRVWCYLVLDHSNPARTNQNLGAFFDCFGIANHAITTGKNWEGLTGGVRIYHQDYNGSPRAKVKWFINRKRQDKLEPWVGNLSTVPTGFDEVDKPF